VLKISKQQIVAYVSVPISGGSSQQAECHRLSDDRTASIPRQSKPVSRDKDALKRAVLDVDALNAFRAVDGHTRADMMEPFLVTLGGITDAGDTFSRLLLAPPSLPEDPFTGSATGCMGAYLWKNGLIDAPTFIAEQGHWLGRPGQATVEALGPRSDCTGVKVSGQGRIMMRGTLSL
jgi:trans-2,3-dihydro-3-hydroxyanthranilate isomerase